MKKKTAYEKFENELQTHSPKHYIIYPQNLEDGAGNHIDENKASFEFKKKLSH